MKKNTVWLLVVLAVVSVGGIGYYIYSKNTVSADVVARPANITRQTIVKGKVTKVNPGEYATFQVKITEGLDNLVGKTMDVRMIKYSTTYSVISPEYGFTLNYPGSQMSKGIKDLIGQELIIAGEDTFSPSGTRYMIANAIAKVDPTLAKVNPGSVSAQSPPQPTNGSSVQTIVAGKVVGVSMGVFTIEVDEGWAKGRQLGINVVDAYTTYSNISKDGSTSAYSALTRYDSSKIPIGASVIVSGKERSIFGTDKIDFIADAVAVERVIISKKQGI